MSPWVLQVVGKSNKPRVVPLPDRVLGHASIATTGIFYLNDDLLERKREMEKLFADRAGSKYENTV